MAEFIVNPRRAPRAPARCRTAVVSSTTSFEAETEDIGSRGCQVVSPKGVKKDDAVRVTIANDRIAEPLHVGGRIAWVSVRFPWRVGIAFDEAALSETTAWFERLVDSHPGLRTLRRLPEKIPVAAAVYLGQPPRFVLDFNEDEAALLRGIGSGARVDDLMARFRARGAGIEHALFSLIARSAVTLVRGQAVHPSVWKPVLDEVEASIAADSLGSGSVALQAPPEPPPAPAAPAAIDEPSATPVPAEAAPGPEGDEARPSRRKGSEIRGGVPIVPPPPPVSAWGTAALDPSPQFEPSDGGLRIEIEEPTPRPAAPATPTTEAAGWPWNVEPAPAPAATPPPAAAAAHAPDFAGKGIGWRKPRRGRDPEAQVAFDRAHSEFLAGNVNGAIALLRRALVLSPGDPEIADVLGKLAFRDRDPGAR